MMDDLEVRDVCLEALDEILRLQEETQRQSLEILRLKLALSCALPTATSEVATLIHTAIHCDDQVPPPRRSAPVLIVDNMRIDRQ